MVDQKEGDAHVSSPWCMLGKFCAIGGPDSMINLTSMDLTSALILKHKALL